VQTLPCAGALGERASRERFNPAGESGYKAGCTDLLTKIVTGREFGVKLSSFVKMVIDVCECVITK
jgi:hypothetical protein